MKLFSVVVEIHGRVYLLGQDEDSFVVDPKYAGRWEKNEADRIARTEFDKTGRKIGMVQLEEEDDDRSS